MFSKLAFSAAALAGAQAALISASGTLTSDMTCHECLTMTNSQYCATETTYGRHASVTASTGKCISSASTCSSGTGIKVGSNSIVEAAHLACPTETGVCGTVASHWTILAGTLEAAVTVGAANAVPAKSGCTFGFKANCGVPVIKSTGTVGADAKIALFHYTNDHRMSSTDFSTSSASVATTFPSTTATIHDLDSNCSGIQCSVANQEGSQWMFRKTSTNVIVQSNDILTEYMNYIQNTAAYQNAFITDYQDDQIEKSSEDPGLLWDIFFGWLFTSDVDEEDDSVIANLSYPGLYTGKKWSELNSLGGWGDLSVQTMDQASAKYYEYGTFGSVTSEPTSATSNSVDINSADCADRYAVVSVYNSGTGTLTASNVQFTLKAYEDSEQNLWFQVPDNAEKFEMSGIMTKSLGVAALSTALLTSLI